MHLNYRAKQLVKDGLLFQLQTISESYQKGLITAEECAKESNEALYTFFSAITDNTVQYGDIIKQHRENFARYRNWNIERFLYER